MACLHPVTIVNAHGEYHRVPCGKCPACLNQRGHMLDQLCEIESSHALATFFVTLTYSDEFLPTAHLARTVVDNYNRVQELAVVNESERLCEYYASEDPVCDQIITMWDRADHSVDMDKLLLPFESGAFGDTLKKDTFGYLCKPDVIKFLKRLRYYITSKVNDKRHAKVRYFLCGEYGPKTFRPHYHCILYVYSSTAKELLPFAVRKSWKFGRVDCQVSGARGCTSYVSRYVNSYTCLPLIHQQAPFRCFSLHSQLFGAETYGKNCKTLADLTYERARDTGNIIHGKLVTNVLSGSLQAALFPKCFGFSVSDARSNLLRYQLWNYLSSEGTKVSEIVAKLKSRDYNFQIREYNLKDLISPSENMESTLTTSLYKSRKFMRLCDRFNVSPYYYYHHVIVPFYKDMEADQVASFYEKMQTDSEETQNYLPVDFIWRYTNMPLLSWDDYMYHLTSKNVSDSIRQAYDRLLRFSDSIGVLPQVVAQVLHDYEDLYEYQQNSLLQNKIAADNVKHKIINDMNKILYG